MTQFVDATNGVLYAISMLHVAMGQLPESADVVEWVMQSGPEVKQSCTKVMESHLVHHAYHKTKEHLQH